MSSPINPNGASIEYQATTKLMDLAYSICITKNRSKISYYQCKAKNIRYFLKALSFKSYLSNDAINAIYQALIDVSEIYNFPTFAALPPSVIPAVGSPPQGPPGPAGADGAPGATGPAGPAGASSKVSFTNAAVTIGTVTLDSFDKTSTAAARWDWVAINGTKYRAGTILADWDGTTVDYSSQTTSGLGSIGSGELIITPVISGTNIVLQATVTSSTWNIYGGRYTMI